MSIKGYVYELTKIKAEISRNNFRNRELRKRMQELNKIVTSYIESKAQTGIKYNNKAIIVEQKSRTIQKKKEDMENDVLLILRNLGIENPRQAFHDLEAARRRDPENTTKLKIKNIKTKM